MALTNPEGLARTSKARPLLIPKGLAGPKVVNKWPLVDFGEIAQGRIKRPLLIPQGLAGSNVVRPYCEHICEHQGKN